MTHKLIFLLLVSIVPAVVACSKRTPVNEVTTASSGVELSDPDVPSPSALGWPAWRGPRGDGIADDQDLPTTWSENEGILWSVDVPGRGHGSPCVSGDKVFLAAADDEAQKQMLLAYDAQTGDALWEQTVHEGNFPSRSEIHHKGSNANGTVLSDGKSAFIAFFNNDRVYLSSYDFEGKQRWQRELGAFSSKFGFAPSPILYRSFVIVAVDNWGGGYIAAVDHESGEIAWRVSRAAKNSHSSPLIANVGGEDHLLICGCDEVASYDPATGEQRWSVAGTAETTCGTMVVNGDRVYASGGYPDRQTICLSNDGTKIWDNRTKIYEPSMIAYEDSIFAISDTGIAYCWSAEDGSERWVERMGGQFSASPVICNGLIYVSDLSGNHYVFRASSKEYQEVAKNRLGNDCYGSPAIANGKIFLRIGDGLGVGRQEKLVCIGK